MKQRLIGTLVLGCLALIIIPLLLDGEGMDAAPGISANIPLEPVFSTIALDAPERPVIVSDQPPAGAPDASPDEIPLPAYRGEPAQTPAESLNTEDSNAIPQFGADGLPEAWSVRLGTFGERANADALMKKLVAGGYKAYNRPVEAAQGTLTAVFVGPVITKTEAGDLVKELSAAYKLNGIVVQFRIEELK